MRVGRMETGHSSAQDRGEDRVQGDDAEGESGGVVERVVDVLHAVGPFHSASLPIPSSTSLSCMSQKKLFDHMTTMKQLTTFFSMFGFLSVSVYFATSTSHSFSELDHNSIFVTLL